MFCEINLPIFLHYQAQELTQSIRPSEKGIAKDRRVV